MSNPILNAIQEQTANTNPILSAIQSSAPTLANIQAKNKIADQQVLDNLPDTLQFAFWDTGVPINEEVSASLVGMGSSMTDVYRGVKQILGIDEDSMREDQQIMDDLYKSSKGAYAVGGAITGALVEPLGFLIPASKGASLAKAAALGVTTGATYGGLSYVNEEAGQTRIGNTVLGGTIGLGLSSTMKAVQNISHAKKVNKASKLIEDIEYAHAEGIVRGKKVSEIHQEMRDIRPNIENDLLEAVAFAGRKPKLTQKIKEAEDIISYKDDISKPNNMAIGADKVLGVLSTRIRNISEAILGRVREHDLNVQVRTQNALEEVETFLQSYSSKVKGTDKKTVDLALLNGDADIVEDILMRHGGGELYHEYSKVRNVLDRFGDESIKAGRFKDKLENYFPRFVKDVDGLRNSLGMKQKSILDKAIEDGNISSLKKRGRRLNPQEASNVINKTLRGFPIKGFKPGSSKQRKIARVNEDMLKFYSSPEESLHSYVRNSIHDLEKLKFFGRDTVYKEIHGRNMLDLNDSIGSLILREGRGKLSPGQEKELKHLLDVRFGIGEKSPAGAVQDVKNIIYAGLLGNPVSAATQLGDVGVAIYINGFRDTLSSLVTKRRVTLKDFGMVDTIAEEFASTRKSSKFLKFSFKWSGFKAIDTLGKETLLNGALRKYETLARKGNIDKISSKYSKIFGDEFPQLISDLKNKKISENVKLLLFNELADVQPITLTEMPEMYLRLPNGRVMYMLKSFMLKQLDIIRRDSYNEIKKGNVAKGLGNLMRYGLIIGSANAGSSYVKDWMLGKDVEPDLPNDIGINLLKTFAWSEYLSNKIEAGKPVEAAMDIVLPPFKMFDKIISTDPSALQFIPIGGKMWYYWFGGGIEEFNTKQQDKQLQQFSEELENL